MSDELEQAKNPEADKEQLQLLSKDSRKAVRRAVAQNPSAPISTLFSLSVEFPREFWENAVLPLLLLENPDLVGQIPAEASAVLLQRSDLPAFFVERTNTQSRHIALRHELAPEVLRVLARDQDPYLRAKVAEQRNTPPEVIASLARDESTIVRRGVAANPSTASEVLATLTEEPDAETLRLLARHPNLTTGILWRMFTSYYPPKRLSTHRLPPEWLSFIESNDFSAFLLSCHASSLSYTARGLTKEQREFLLEGGYGALFFLVSDASCPAAVLVEVAARSVLDSRGERLLRFILEHPNATSALQESLARSSDRRARLVVASWELASPSLLEALSVDPEESVRVAVALNPNTPARCREAFLSDNAPLVRRTIALHPGLCLEMLERLAKDPEDSVRSQVAARVDCPSLLLRLSHEQSSYVLASLARNPSLPPETFAILAQSPRLLSFGRELVSNPSIPLSLLRELSIHEDFFYGLTQSDREEVQSLLVNFKEWRIRRALASSEHARPHILERLSSDPVPSVREAVASNQNTSKEIVERLRQTKKKLAKKK